VGGWGSRADRKIRGGCAFDGMGCRCLKRGSTLATSEVNCHMPNCLTGATRLRVLNMIARKRFSRTPFQEINYVLVRQVGSV